MKITKKQLRRIIKEEKAKLIKEQSLDVRDTGGLYDALEREEAAAMSRAAGTSAGDHGLFEPSYIEDMLMAEVDNFLDDTGKMAMSKKELGMMRRAVMTALENVEARAKHGG